MHKQFHLEGKYFPLVFSILLIVSSCDPMRRLQMQNDTQNEVKFVWKMKEADSSYLSPFFTSNSNTSEFTLKATPPHHFVNMSFGPGNWNHEYLADLTSRLESLHIYSAADSIRIQSSENIYAYLWKHRKGIGKRKIELTVKK